MEALKALSKELNEPGVDKLWAAVRRRGLDLTRQQVADFAGTRHHLEPLRMPRRFLGRTAAEGAHERWQGDLALMDVRLGFKGFILFVDVYTRMAFAQSVSSKEGPVVAAAFQKILARAPKKPAFITVDAGGEFRGAFERVCDDRGIVLAVKRPEDVQAIAVCDRAMENIKLALKKRVNSQQGQWPTLLQTAVRGYNNTVHPAVHAEPSQVESVPVANFMTLQDNALKMAHNNDLEQKRGEAMVRAGWFRPALKNHRIKAKIGDLRYGRPIKFHAVRAGVLFDLQGREHLLKTALPVRRP